MGVRASIGLPSLDGKKGMFIAGLYNRAYEEEVTELVNCPDVTGYELVLDGEPVLPDSRCLTEFERKFNIHTGELVITSTYELESGVSFCLTDRRFASMENEHLFVQSIGITMQKGCIKHGGICTGIDGQQTNSGVWVYNQLMPEIDLQPMWQMSHLRSGDREIDFVVTNENGAILGIEVKASQSVSTDDFKHLQWFKYKILRPEVPYTGIVLYAGNAVRSFGNGCFAVPFTLMWGDN